MSAGAPSLPCGSKRCPNCAAELQPVSMGGAPLPEVLGCASCRESWHVPAEHEYEFSRYCGARVCVSCDDHRGLAHCYCGWPNGRGRAELVEMGEQIDDDY